MGTRRSLSNQSDEDLARQSAKGDRRALETLLDRHSDRIYAVCRRVLNHPEDSQDAAQEAMIAVTRGIAKFDGRSQFTTWLYRVATNAALDEARRRQRRPLIVENLPETRTSDDVASDVANKIVIEDAMAMVAPEFRACIALRDLMGFDYAQIADILEIPPGTVRSRIARGRGALAGLLASTNSDEIGNQTTTSQRPTFEP